MNTKTLAAGLLRLAGALLVILGVVHLVATPHLPALLDPMRSAQQYPIARGATLLNHVLVGVLLLPLGFTTWLAAARNNITQAWARATLRVNAVATMILPISIFVFMREAVSSDAPMFLVGVGLATLVAMLFVAATLISTAGK